MDPETEEGVNKLYDLVSKAKEPRKMYEEVRDSLKSLYKYLFASGILNFVRHYPSNFKRFTSWFALLCFHFSIDGSSFFMGHVSHSRR